MNLKQNGLEKRIEIEARRISSQHRQLDEFHERVARALEHGEPAEVRSAFTRFRDALEAHFAVEDEVYFPAVHGLRRELEPELTAFVEQHKVMRLQLERVQTFIDADRLTEGAAVLDAMVELLIGHETREEQLLARIRAGG
jgi:iron-sulfur cluster repair protein YtfE (RIC family)